MKSFYGKVVKVAINIPIKKADNSGMYTGWSLSYEDADGKMNTIQKPIQGLQFKQTMKKTLESLVPGEDVEIQMKKGEKFWDVVNVIKAGTPAQGQTNEYKKESTVAAPTKYKTDRDFESSEERALKQVLIVRQSSLSAAIALTPKGSAEAVLGVAETFEKWVLRDTKFDTPPETPDEVE